MKSANSRDASAALSSTARVTPNWYIATMRCDQSSSCGAHVARHAEQVGDDGDGNRRREFREKIGRAFPRESVDPLMRERGDGGRELLDLARDEGAVDEGAQPRVLGRLEFEQRVALERVEGREMRLSARASRVASRLITCRICRPKRRSRSSADTSAWRAKHQKP